MVLLRRIFDFYINSSVHVSIAVCVLMGITLMEFEIPFSFLLMSLVFFSSITGYNFVKYATVAGIRRKSLSPFLKQVQILSMISFAAMLILLMYQTAVVLSLLGLLALITFFYTVPLLKNKNLRGLQSIKIFIVALVWSGVTVLTPIIDLYSSITIDQWISFLQRFLLVVVLTIPFEIRDLSYDQETLGTFPQKLGIRTSKVIGIVILAIVLILEYLKNTISGSYQVSLFVICLVTCLFLIMSKENQSKYYASFWVEGIPMVWMLVMYLLY